MIEMLYGKWIYLVGFLTAYLSPINEALWAVGILIVIDTIFGMLAARKSGNKIESRKLGRILTKTLAYNLLIISAYISQTHLSPSIPFVKITLGFIAVTEFLSIGENFSTITGKSFIKYIKGYLSDKLENIKK